MIKSPQFFDILETWKDIFHNDSYVYYMVYMVNV